MEYTEYQGVEVITFESKVKGRHPRWGYDEKTLFDVRGTSLLGLADGVFLVVCDECGYNGITGNDPYAKPEGEQKPIIKQVDSVMSHKSGTHWAKRGRPPIYNEARIKVIIKVYLKWKASNIRSWMQAACVELDQLGFKPAISSHWTPGSLGNLIRTYSKQEPYKNLKAGPMNEEDRQAIAEMVREAASAGRSKAGTHVADNVRITAKRPLHAPVVPQDAVVVKQEDVEVTSPTLNFGGGPDQTKTLVVDAVHAAKHEVVDNGFIRVADLADGTLLFTHNGVLMAGKPVKGIEV